jgi:hypothetical protein
MSIQGRFFTLLVRRADIERVYPGGLDAYVQTNSSVCSYDEELVGVSFMDAEGAYALLEELEAFGLVGVEGGQYKDVAILSRWQRPPFACPWLTEGRDGRYWLTGTGPSDVALTTWQKLEHVEAPPGITAREARDG